MCVHPRYWVLMYNKCINLDRISITKNRYHVAPKQEQHLQCYILSSIGTASGELHSLIREKIHAHNGTPIPYPMNVTFLVPPSTPLAPNPDLASAISTQELEALPVKVTPPFWIVAFIPDLRPSKEPNKVPRTPSSASYR